MSESLTEPVTMFSGDPAEEAERLELCVDDWIDRSARALMETERTDPEAVQGIGTARAELIRTRDRLAEFVPEDLQLAAQKRFGQITEIDRGRVWRRVYDIESGSRRPAGSRAG